MIWLLLIIFFAPPSQEILETYTTEEACQGERNRIGFAMAEAYPYEADFRIECWLKEAV